MVNTVIFKDMLFVQVIKQWILATVLLQKWLVIRFNNTEKLVVYTQRHIQWYVHVYLNH